MRPLPSRLLHMSSVAISVAFLAGCAGTKVHDIDSSGDSILASPRTIAVVTEVELSTPPRHETPEAQRASAHVTAAALDEKLTGLFGAHALRVVPPDAHPDLILRNRIVDIRTGSRALRLWVGYGAGKAELRVNTALMDPNHAVPVSLLSFQSTSTSGGMPSGGLISPALRSLSRDGLDTEVAETSAAIDKQVALYFAEQHWPYPARGTVSPQAPAGASSP